MNRQQRIISILMESFTPSQLEVVDDSAKHAGHAGASPAGETHFSIRIESPALKGKSRVAQHQAIYSVLDAEFKSGLHALAISVQ